MVLKYALAQRCVASLQDWKTAKESGWKPPVYDNEEQRKEVQKGFLFKVYGLLAMQLAVTVAFCALFMMVPVCNSFAIANPWICLITMLFTIIILVALFFLKNQYP